MEKLSMSFTPTQKIKLSSLDTELAYRGALKESYLQSLNRAGLKADIDAATIKGASARKFL
jgi:hypothetical protein